MTENMKVFCDEYLIDFNGTRAYKTAYPDIGSDESAAATASRLLKNVKVKNYLSKRIKDREKRTEITQDQVLQELAKVGFANITDYANIVTKGKKQKVEIKDTSTLRDDQQAAISEIKNTKDGIEIKLNDKLRALELMGRHLGMFTDKVKLDANMGVTIIDDIPKVSDKND